MILVAASYNNMIDIDDIGIDIPMVCMSSTEQVELVEYLDTMDMDSDIGFDMGWGKIFGLGLNVGSGIDYTGLNSGKDTSSLCTGINCTVHRDKTGSAIHANRPST